MSPRDGFLADYEPVEDRLAKFWNDHKDGRVVTELVELGRHGEWVVKASVYRNDETEPFAVGHAHETVGEGNVNRTSALENCETSAVGRALANGGYAPKGKRPSREEMVKTTSGSSDDQVARVSLQPPGHQQSPAKPSGEQRPKPQGPPNDRATTAQVASLKLRLREVWGIADEPDTRDEFNEAAAKLLAAYDRKPGELEELHRREVTGLLTVIASEPQKLAAFHPVVQGTSPAQQHKVSL